MNAFATQMAHVEGRVQISALMLDQTITGIMQKRDHVGGCLMILSDHAFGSALLSWFRHRDLASTRQWLYAVSRLDQTRYRWIKDTDAPMARAGLLVKPLVSNYLGLIRWFAECDDGYDLKRVEDVRTWDYLGYQAPLALRGDWDRLAQRSLTAVDYLSATKNKIKYLADQEFFLALAQQNRAGMEAALERLTQPRLVRSRSNQEHGLAENLISTAAVAYAKIAWLHGHEVQVNSPLVPAEWLPMEPLPQYEKRYAFLPPP